MLLSMHIISATLCVSLSLVGAGAHHAVPSVYVSMSVCFSDGDTTWSSQVDIAWLPYFETGFRDALDTRFEGSPFGFLVPCVNVCT